jgi:hypothetical protein
MLSSLKRDQRVEGDWEYRGEEDKIITKLGGETSRKPTAFRTAYTLLSALQWNSPFRDLRTSKHLPPWRWDLGLHQMCAHALFNVLNVDFEDRSPRPYNWVAHVLK